jgi:SAM-dependent methyltransferase
MSFSLEWDARYKANAQLSVWPWSDLIGFVMRYSRPTGPEYRVLELGCGAGANIPFFRDLGVHYYAIEGSPAIVETLWRKFPELQENIMVGDFTKSIPFPVEFDLIVDRSSLTHNSTSSIKRCLSLVCAQLRANGKYIGIDWFSTRHSEFHKGLPDEDVNTKSGYTEGQFSQVGRVHFSNQTHLQELFDNFTLEVLEHKIITKQIPMSDHVFAAWNLVGRKKAP